MTPKSTDANRRNADDAVFEAVSRGVVEWSQRDDLTETAQNVQYQLRGYLRRHLRRAGFHDVADAISLPRQSKGCDLVIDDRIGIIIVSSLNDGSKEWIHKVLRSLFQKYDYLIVYGHQISSEFTDLWRQITRSIRRRERDGKQVAVHGTFDVQEIRNLLADTITSPYLLKKWTVYGLFFLALVFGGQYAEWMIGTAQMGQAFVGAVFVVNAAALLGGLFLLRYF